MTARRGGLGRGLGTLIPVASSAAADSSPAPPGPRPVGGAVFRELPLDLITPNPRQPRSSFDEESLEELAASLRQVGMLQPVVVREVLPDQYELVMVERRWRAARIAEMDVLPAIVRDTADDAMLRDALLENLHRAQLNPLEEAAAYDQLLEDFECTHEELAGRVGKSRSHVSNTLRLLGLPPAVQRRVAAGVLSAGHARALLALDDPQAQDRLAQRIVAEGLSVRAVEEIVATAGQAPRERARRTKGVPPPELTALAHRLTDHLDTRVSVDVARRRGKLVIEFATMEDLERIVREIAPNLLDGNVE